jgi:SRSO17 transposase
VGYVLAIARNHRIQVTLHLLRERVDVTAAHLSEQAWQRYSCGPGSKGTRWYDWAWVTIHDDAPGCHSLLIRRGSDGELAFYRCWTAQPVPLTTLVRVAGARWAVEEAFQQGKGQVGLDHYQCRQWKAWYRFATLAMLALAMLAAVAVTGAAPQDGLIALTVPETRRLLNLLVLTKRPDIQLSLRWSSWRRRHQATAMASHHKRRQQLELSR